MTAKKDTPFNSISQIHKYRFYENEKSTDLNKVTHEKVTDRQQQQKKSPCTSAPQWLCV